MKRLFEASCGLSKLTCSFPLRGLLSVIWKVVNPTLSDWSLNWLAKKQTDLCARCRLLSRRNSRRYLSTTQPFRGNTSLHSLGNYPNIPCLLIGARLPWSGTNRDYPHQTSSVSHSMHQ
ncbi:hypothetical protein CBM2599_B50322 [Cupriavidus taiwanensis]|nr:hypothetical protein CBM2600_B10671 [Cupriavidus taiwanensis]SOY96390.1 hypothetical protein CBM2599_B50322 [Cupriavidus taiwanensis]